MPKLNQIIAVVNGKKNQTQKTITELYKKLQKQDLFSGLIRTYKPVDEDGDTLPPEKTLIRASVRDIVEGFKDSITDLIDTVVIQDIANTEAKADIVVNGNVIANDVPVTHLMFLEKQLVDIHTFVSTLPVLDEASEWRFDDNKDCYTSEPEVKNRDLKFTEHKVVYEATTEHPAQVAEINITKKAGEFTTIKLSGAIPASDKRNMVRKVVELQEAVKFAREQANSIEVSTRKIAGNILEYIFEKRT